MFVYQMDSYHYWQRELKRDDFTFGQFGENFTVEGLADSEVCIGDRYRIGGALFEVTQPRMTCYCVGIRDDVGLGKGGFEGITGTTPFVAGIYIEEQKEGKIYGSAHWPNLTYSLP